MPAVAVAAGSALVSGIMKSKSAKKVNKTNQKAIQAVDAENVATRDANIAQNQPWIDNGLNAMNWNNALMNGDMEHYNNSAFGKQAEVMFDLGSNRLSRLAHAGGAGGSGGALRDLGLFKYQTGMQGIGNYFAQNNGNMNLGFAGAQGNNNTRNNFLDTFANMRGASASSKNAQTNAKYGAISSGVNAIGSAWGDQIGKNGGWGFGG